MGETKPRLGTDPTLAAESMQSIPNAVDTQDRAELVPGTMVGEYRIEGVLGSGGMGRVYAAVHPVIGKLAAVKVLHPALSVEREAVERFIQEARSVNQIGHPNIVDIFSFGTLPDGRCYFVMEQLRGESLGSRIDRERLPVAEALAFLDSIAIALEAAHKKGIVHRDLKPDNVFLVAVEGSTPQVKLLDFGIAKLVGGGGQAPLQRTRTGNVMGTPAYISPEQARGEGVDHRTDVYAFGAVAYELFTGQWPFPATNAADMIAKHLFEAPPSPRALNPDVDPELDHLVTALLAKDVDERPTLEETRKQLRAAQRRIHQRTALHEGGHTDPVVDISGLPSRDPLALSMPIDPPPSATAFHRAETRERKLFVIGGAVIGLAVLIVGGLLLFGKGSKSPAPPAPQATTPAPQAAAPAPQATAPQATAPEAARPPSAPVVEVAVPVTVPVVGTTAAPTDKKAPATTAAATTATKKPATKPAAKPATKPSTTSGTTTKPTKPADDPDAPM